MKYTVANQNYEIIGQANNWGDAKDIHKKNLPKELLPYYAGLDVNTISEGDVLMPSFYVLPPKLALKYGYQGE